MTDTEIIRGITLFNGRDHIAIDYPPRASRADGVHVVEMPTSRLFHNAIKGGDPRGRLSVFGRWITNAEHQERRAAYAADPEEYLKQQLVSLGEGGE